MCLICHKEYVYEKFLTRHMVSKHRACAPVHQYTCRHCDAIFADEAGFDEHTAHFFNFLTHHLDRVLPKQREQEEQAEEFQDLLSALEAEEGGGAANQKKNKSTEKENKTNGKKTNDNKNDSKHSTNGALNTDVDKFVDKYEMGNTNFLDSVDNFGKPEESKEKKETDDFFLRDLDKLLGDDFDSLGK
jgi:hypothetical protein